MLEYLARLEIHDLEAAKLWLLGLYVISLIGIVLGVYWEHEDFEKSKRHIGWRLLIGSLAFETLLTVLIFVADAEISRRQKAEIAQLEWLVGGRQLAPAQIEAIARDLVQFSGRKLFITSYAGDAEAARLALQIKSVLERANIEVDDNIGRTLAGRGGVSFGIHISGPPGDKGFMEAIARALTVHGKINLSSKFLEPKMRIEDAVIGIMVALRPL